MSELAYMTHLKQINGRLEFRQINLNIDLCVDYLHLLDQVNVLDQYLYYNNLLLRENNSSGYRDLDGFEDKTVIEWNKENNEKEQNKLLEKKIRKLLYIKRNTIEEPIRVHKFDISEFNEIEEPEYIESELEQNIESSDEINEKWLEPIEEDNYDLFDTLSEEQSIENKEEIAKTFDTIDEDIEDEQELEDNTPLLGDMYNDLVQANQLLEDTEDDNYDFVDEYAIEEDEEEIDKTFEENEDDTDYSEEFEFENPSNLNSLENNTNTSFTNTYKRDIRTTDKMVDKTTDAINQGINNILKRLAGK